MQYALFYIDFFVNYIQKNHHLTALNGDFIIVCVTFLIMPFIGLSPFLPEERNHLHMKAIRVNALYRAFSISTSYADIKKTLDYTCQCPLSGFLHFYTQYWKIANDILEECQCPLTGFFHFYKSFSVFINPLQKLCQCPLSGFLHFYYVDNELARCNVCQCPLSGFLHFYLPSGNAPK